MAKLLLFPFHTLVFESKSKSNPHSGQGGGRGEMVVPRDTGPPAECRGCNLYYSEFFCQEALSLLLPAVTYLFNHLHQ